MLYEKMLQAQSSEGKLITLAKLTSSEIEFYRKETQFFCPTCQQPVMVKSGPQVIPHFAHYSKSKCPSRSGGEGPYHEKGKLILYQWLKSQNINVTLEKYLNDIDQQPDLFIKINHKRIAVEFQCARMSVRDIQKRNNGYQLAGIVPIWILGANLFKRKGKYHLKVDQYTLQFVHQFTSALPFKLYYFCPQSMKMVTFEDFYLTRKNQAIGNFRFFNLSQLRFPDLFWKQPFSKQKLYELWKLEKKKFRLQPQKQLYGQDRAWYQWLYLQNTHKEYLPSIVHLPVRNQFMMRSPTWNWQSRLYLQIINKRPLSSQFSMNECKKVLQKHLYNPNYFPLIKSLQNPIRQYLKLLKHLKYIKQTKRNEYIIIKKPTFHKHVEESLKNDMIVIEQLISAKFKRNSSMNG